MPKKRFNKQVNSPLTPLQKNDMVEGEVTSQGNTGEGILRVDNYPIFIPGSLPGEIIRSKVLKANRSHAFGRLQEILTSSDQRQEPPCPYYGQCGGCNMQHQAYQAQLDFKTKRVKDCFERIAGIKNPPVEETVGMADPWHYRNKVQLPIAGETGDPSLGFYRGRSHQIVDIESCLIQSKRSDDLMGLVRTWLKHFQIPVVATDEDVAPGKVRHLLIREGRNSNQWMVVLVATSPSVPHLDELKQSLLEAFQDLTSLVLNINDQVTNRVLGRQNINLYGDGYIVDSIGEIQYRISPHSFYQVNPEQTKVIYDKVLELADFKGDETVLDLYCGAGSIALYVAQQVKEVIGVEVVPQAIEDANFNKELNQIQNASFHLGKSEDMIQDLMKQAKQPDFIIVDPPRKGCEPSLLEAIGNSTIKNMIYVSCDPATLARDVGILANYGFSPQIIQPVDNFPQTHHVETVALLSKLDVDKHISVKIELDELDLTSAESKATYEQIKEYILNKFGLKVSALYIAQIKKKCGIELRENYNKSKKEKQVIPQCTPEKEDAIMDALMHFKMI